MIRGTTPEYVLTIDGYDLSDKTVYVTISQRGTRLTKTGDDLRVVADDTGSTIVFLLTQSDTLRLTEGQADIQIRFIDSQGTAYATDIAQITVGRILFERVIKYAEQNDG